MFVFWPTLMKAEQSLKQNEAIKRRKVFSWNLKIPADADGPVPCRPDAGGSREPLA